MRNQAKLKMGEYFSNQERDARVDQLLTDLGLKKCQHTLIGTPGVSKSLSGGERKRLSFATQVSFLFF